MTAARPAAERHTPDRHRASGVPYPARRVDRLGIDEATRGVRIVHPLDGILAAVAPHEVIRAGQQLWTAWTERSTSPGPDLLLGLDAGGILPTVAVALASGLPYRLAWKLDLALPHKRRFAEPHARRTDVFTYGDLRETRVLIVDDEVTTGRTACNLAAVLRAEGATVLGVACLIEDSAGGAADRLHAEGLPLCTLTRL